MNKALTMNIIQTKADHWKEFYSLIMRDLFILISQHQIVKGTSFSILSCQIVAIILLKCIIELDNEWIIKFKHGIYFSFKNHLFIIPHSNYWTLTWFQCYKCFIWFPLYNEYIRESSISKKLCCFNIVLIESIFFYYFVQRALHIKNLNLYI